MESNVKKPRAVRGRRTQEERSDTTQRKIIKSALHILHTKGFRSANLQDIARGARVTLGALQHHFANRQVLMERLIDEMMAPLADAGEVWPSADSPLKQRALEFVQACWQSLYGTPDFVGVWSLIFGCRSDPELFDRIEQIRSQSDPVLYSRFVKCFPEIQASHPHPEQLAGLVFSTLRGIGIYRIYDVPTVELDGQLEALADLIVASGKAKRR